ncbi:MAG TPA: serine hydrolase domain-containing protein [Phenylobacterium sp.]|jgi:CubicO group peptidase (beta-lactamase class C family)|uniref:serine hydrolase domain-containing protein n=1 Tax=Phenylobacterium sp. TaxID=1871053 RepID=UPI002BCDAA6B|nr:serine hydrolase domain-containing protein [Phenylobacterium sp.]HXA39856.1 serine hydrolase domain-containing protein [Phenylobacterium sp.]
MHRRAYFATALTAALLVAGACAAADAPAAKPAAKAAAVRDLSATAAPEAVGFDSRRLKSLDDYMAKVVSDGRVAGMTTLLARHGKVVEFKTYGKTSLETGQAMPKDEIFRIYSMSKPLTGVAMMILFEQGKWRLDDPVTRYVPEFKNLKVMVEADKDGNITKTEPMKRPPTMREIMSHTAGFGYGLGDEHPVDKLYRKNQVLGATGLHQMIERTAEIPLMYQPGTNWSYSSAVDIQGYIVEKLTGKTLGQFLQENVFAPLKMRDTAFYTGADKAHRLAAVYVAEKGETKIHEAKELFGNKMPDYSKPPAMESGGGGLTSTTMDYARFCQMMLNKGELDGVRILSPASVELMDTNVIPRNVLLNTNGTSVLRFNEAVGFGLDFQVDMNPRRAGSLEGRNTMSWGGAAGTWFWIDPTNDVLFVGMIQRMGGSGGDDLGTMARTLTYQALLHPEK